MRWRTLPICATPISTSRPNWSAKAALPAAQEWDILESRETYDIHPDDAWQRLKLCLRKPQELAILKYVAAFR